VNSSWLSTLDAFEQHLALQSRLVDQGRYDEVVAFDPRSDLPALPRVFVPRAMELHERAEALTQRVAELREQAQQRRVAPRRPVHAAPAASAYLDQRA
jgi:uncharacterized protein YfaS (alpha-2-macroglobulin family)